MKFYIATPTYDGRVEAEYVASVTALRAVLGSLGHETHQDLWCYDSFIDRARNRLLRRFLDSDATHIWFIDADVGFDHIAAARMALRGRQFIGGVYPKRSNVWQKWPAHVLHQGDRIEVDKGCIRAGYVPGGFMLLERSAIEAMRLAYADLYWKDEDYENAVSPRLFEVSYADHLCTGEDITFCNRWRAIGGDIWVDPDIDFTHVGSNRFTGNFHKHLAGEA